MTTKTQRKRASQEKSIQMREARIPRITTKNQKQFDLHSALMKHPLVIATGPAGTGKSYVGAGAALHLLSEGKIDKIVITRNPLPTGQSLGFFQGDAMQKMMVWAGPIVGTMKKICSAHVNDGYFDCLVHGGKIEFVPIETMKGSSFDNTFIFVEEAQECDEEVLKMLSTRAGEGSKVFFNGDSAQSNKRLRTKDFEDFLSKIEKFEDAVDAKYDQGIDMEEWETLEVPVVKFEKSDIVRSDLARKMVEILY